MCQSLFFDKVARLRSQACNFIKKETLVRRLLEGDAYFNVDTQMCDAYSRAVLIWGPALITGNTVIVGSFMNTQVIWV